jgi:hypothetical protein
MHSGVTCVAAGTSAATTRFPECVACCAEVVAQKTWQDVDSKLPLLNGIAVRMRYPVKSEYILRLQLSWYRVFEEK